MLARRFAFFVLLPLLLLVAAAGAMVYVQTADHLVDRHDRSLLAAADALDAAISARLASFGDDLQVIARYRQFKEHFQFLDFGRPDLADRRLRELEETFVAAAELEPDREAIRLHDADGRALINVVAGKRVYRAYDAAEARWFRAALAAGEDEAFVSNVHAAPGSGAATITVSRPVWFRKRVRAVLAVDVVVPKLVEGLLAAAAATAGGDVHVVDPGGRIVASEPEAGGALDLPAAARVREGYRGIAWNDDVRVAYKPQARTDLGLVLAVPRDVVFAAVRQLERLVFPVTALGFVVVALSGLWLVRRAVRSVRILTEGAERVAAGRLDLTLDVSSGDELEALAKSFNRMTRSLRAARDTVDTTSAELMRTMAEEEKRTSELEEAYLELQETQRQLVQAEKMGLLGQLAGGIAHDFNNLLGGILGCADLLRRRTDPADRTRYIETILETGHRAADLVRQLLVFSRPGPATRAPVDVHALVAEVVRILRHTIDPGIKVATRLKAERATVEGDGSELQSALLNLGINARDAMPDGGRLTFSTGIVHFDAQTVAMLPEKIEPGAYLEIGVADTGVGMTPEVQAHIFEPFYSTKPAGRGTGLGLAAVYGTVRGHGGAIDVYSEPGRGSRFKLFLPLAAVDVEPAASEVPDLVRGTGHILLVDDDAVIRNLASDMLRLLGYEVTAAESGEQALALYRADPDRFDLALVDVVMPRMDGRTFLRELRRIDPDARVLLASGFSLDADLPEDERAAVAGFVSKPFVVAGLSRAVAAALARKTLRVLVADDAAVNRQVVTAFLGELGHTVHAVGDGEAAVAAAAAERFDLALLDIELPGRTGFEATAAIRARERETGGRLPIIAMTGHGDAERDRCRAADMDGFLAKPLTFDEFRRELARVSGRSTSRPPRAPDRELASRLARAFLDEAPRLLGELEAAVAADDAQALHRVAHTLYGSLRHFDADEAGALADRLQDAARAGAARSAASLASELAVECERVVRRLEAGLADEVQSAP